MDIVLTAKSNKQNMAYYFAGGSLALSLEFHWEVCRRSHVPQQQSSSSYSSYSVTDSASTSPLRFEVSASGSVPRESFLFLHQGYPNEPAKKSGPGKHVAKLLRKMGRPA